MTTLIEFLEARIAEDEADEFGEVTPRHLDDCDHLSPPPGPFPCNCSGPARVLAECAAKRQIIAEHGSFHANASAAAEYTISREPLNWDYTGCITCLPPDEWQHGLDDYWPCPTLRALAAPYADHSDFDSAWAGLTVG